jgi:prophage regulatory protein
MKRFLKLEEVKHATGLSRAALYQKISRGEFPRQCRLGERSVAWVSTEVEAWIEQTIKTGREVAA